MAIRKIDRCPHEPARDVARAIGKTEPTGNPGVNEKGGNAIRPPQAHPETELATAAWTKRCP